jgi:hypothetical protein
VKTWSANASVSAGKYIGEVEAETAEEAIEKAWNHKNAACSVCHQCSEEVCDPEFTAVHVYCDETEESGTDERNFFGEIAALKARIEELEAKLEQK